MNQRVTDGTHHCLVAQRMCLEEVTCSTVLHSIYEACGHINANSCTAQTQLRCLASLAALQHNRLFKSACVCTDESSDAQCRTFRDYLHRNPCFETGRHALSLLAPKQEMPSCNEAIQRCSQSDKCKRIVDHFRRVCKTQDGRCEMTRSVKCERAVERIKVTPLYGCHCHRTDDDTDCEMTYKEVNANPCIEALRLQSYLQHSPINLSKAPSEEETAVPDEDEHLFSPVQIQRVSHQKLFEWQNKDNFDEADQGGQSAITDYTVQTPAKNSIRGPSLPNSTRRPSYRQHQHQRHHQKHHNRSPRPHNQDHLSQTEWPAVDNGPVPPNEVQEPVLSAPRNAQDLHEEFHRPNQESPQDSAQIHIAPTSTCTWAQQACERSPACNLLLEDIYLMCNRNGAACNRSECMAAVRKFYHLGNPDKTFDIAFCSCRLDDDVCLALQRQLHPTCAQTVSSMNPNKPTECTDLAEMCETNGDCKYRLQSFVDACAVDKHTFGCQSSSRLCQEALVGILGTPVRISCGCSGRNRVSLYRCTEWQRIVWLNPCIAQAQKEYVEYRVNSVPMLPRQESNIVPNVITADNTTPPLPVMTPAVIAQASPMPMHETTATTTTTFRPLIVAATMAPPISPYYCNMKKPDGTGNYIIALGSGKRVYHKTQPDCSYVCMCEYVGGSVCKDLQCTKQMPCQTTFAVYSHASPAYQAHRGRCICYSGKFICMKPSPQLYSLRQGVFLFLGYSELEENELRPHTKLGILDSVKKVQDIVENTDDNSGCKLQKFTHIGDNIVLQAYLDEFTEYRENNSMTEEMVNKEKDQCYAQLKNLTVLINSNDPQLRKDVALSLFKLAEVEVHAQTPNGGGHLEASGLIFLSIFITLYSMQT